MSVSYNRVILAGNITRDPELRFTQGGIPVCNFGLAQNKVRGDKEHTNFFDITAWRDLGETVANYKKKGDPILLEGRLEYRTWEDQETGKTRSKVEVVADNIQFLGGGKNGSNGGGGGASGGRRGDAELDPEEMEDIPFRAVNAKRMTVEDIL